MNHDNMYIYSQAVSDLIYTRQWHQSSIFPRVTMCDFQVRRMGNIQRYTVQCVLMMNMINEKLYLLLWFWFIAIAICTAINFLYVCAIFLIPILRVRSVIGHITTMERKVGVFFVDKMNI